MADIDGVLKDIEAGKLDDRLQDLLGALNRRNKERAVSTRWRITLAPIQNGDAPFVVTEDDLTIDEWEEVERLTGKTWTTIHPIGSAANMKAILIAAYKHREFLSHEAAVARIGKTRGSALLDCVDLVEVRRTPLPSGGSTSS
jgi:hypothetical protein